MSAKREMPRRAPELRLPYPLLEYLRSLPGDYMKIATVLLQRAQWVPGCSPSGIPLDAGETLIALRSPELRLAAHVDRELGENGWVSLLRRVLARLEKDGYVAIRATHRIDMPSGTRPDTRNDTPATIVRFLKFRENLWPRSTDATQEATRQATRGPTHKIDAIPAVDPADPFPASANAGSSSAWSDLSAELRCRLRPDLYERWFAPLTASQSGEELLLLAPNRFHQSFVEDNFRVFLEQALATQARGPVRVRVATALLS
jgi:hypothetical protein